MGFGSVYQNLKELFPQVDARLLKAVAIENSKDPDAAVEYVLTEVLLRSGDRPIVQTSGVKNNVQPVLTSESFDGINAYSSGLWNHDGKSLDGDSLSSSFYDAKENYELPRGKSTNEELILYQRCEETGSKSEEGDRLSASSDLGESSEHNINQEWVVHGGVSVAPVQDKETDQPVTRASVSSSSLACVEDADTVVGLGNSGHVQLGCTYGLSSPNSKLSPVIESHIEQSSAGCNMVHCKISFSSASEDQSRVGLSVNAHLEAENSRALANDILDMSTNAYPDFLHEFDQTANVIKCDTLPSTIVTRSGQVCRVNLLEDIIDEARKYKDTVFSAMESVIKLMDEVELQEKEAERAKVAASRGGFDILERVEEIKKMLKHAKEANELHGGEVYGEKSILATEVRELQARLFGLSDEKDKSLSVLEEMRINLEDRLTVAEQQRRAAEQELFDKQESAQSALTEQELIMDKVVLESKVLEQEAEKNSKLRDFLMEKGRVVDVLQGELSVLCQDVKVLKENVVNNYAFSKSLDSERTSCRLASSNSSVKSVGSLKSRSSLGRTDSMKSTTSLKSSAASDPTVQQMDLPESPARTSLSSLGDSQSPKSNAWEESVRHEASRAILDDDWELCDMI